MDEVCAYIYIYTSQACVNSYVIYIYIYICTALSLFLVCYHDVGRPTTKNPAAGQVGLWFDLTVLKANPIAIARLGDPATVSTGLSLRSCQRVVSCFKGTMSFQDPEIVFRNLVRFLKRRYLCHVLWDSWGFLHGAYPVATQY